MLEDSTDWQPDLEMLEGGWLRLVNPLPGWEGFTLDVKAGRLNGEPRIVGLRLEPRDGAPAGDVALSQVRLRRLPLGPLARAAYGLATMRPDTMPDVIDALAAVAAEVSAPRADPRQSTTPEQVARVYADARRDGLAPRKAVCDALHISPRTADRYISDARRRGLLPRYDERKTGGAQ